MKFLVVCIIVFLFCLVHVLKGFVSGYQGRLTELENKVKFIGENYQMRMMQGDEGEGLVFDMTEHEVFEDGTIVLKKGGKK